MWGPLYCTAGTALFISLVKEQRPCQGQRAHLRSPGLSGAEPGLDPKALSSFQHTRGRMALISNKSEEVVSLRWAGYGPE